MFTVVGQLSHHLPVVGKMTILVKDIVVYQSVTGNDLNLPQN